MKSFWLRVIQREMKPEKYASAETYSEAKVQVFFNGATTEQNPFHALLFTAVDVSQPDVAVFLLPEVISEGKKDMPLYVRWDRSRPCNSSVSLPDNWSAEGWSPLLA